MSERERAKGDKKEIHGERERERERERKRMEIKKD